MRLDLFPSGLVDDMACEAVSVEIGRVGDSRYRLRVTGEVPIEVLVWTTRKGRVRAEPWEGQPDWVGLTFGEDDELESLSAADCSVHLEHLDRDAYFLGLSRDSEHWGLNLRAHGYIKTRVVRNGDTAA